MSALSKWQLRFLSIAIFVTGATALILEIVGSRVISPYYGTSIYCWSALITVTLLSLAIGYKGGGSLSEKKADYVLVPRLLLLTGISVFLIPILRKTVLSWSSTFGIQAGALLSAAILLAPCLILLGMLGPFVVRLRSEAVKSAGKVTGDIFFLSTFGSVVGAISAGYLLIPYFRTSTVLYGLSCSILVLSLVGFWSSRVKSGLGLTVTVLVVSWSLVMGTTKQQGNMIYDQNSFYGKIQVVDSDPYRLLLVNGGIQSAALLKNLKENCSPYIDVMEGAVALRENKTHSLCIGLGAGFLPTSLKDHYGIPADVVEIDPQIYNIAKTFFNYSNPGSLFINDGRTFVSKSSNLYDFIFLDAFFGDNPPFHLFTEEAFSEMFHRLNEGGVLVVNLLVDDSSEGNQLLCSIDKAASKSFRYVHAFRIEESVEYISNVILFCSNEPMDFEQALSKTRLRIRKYFEQTLKHPLTFSSDVIIQSTGMSDDYAPFERLMSKTFLKTRIQIQKTMGDYILTD